jgi:hypothetical protein
MIIDPNLNLALGEYDTAVGAASRLMKGGKDVCKKFFAPASSTAWQRSSQQTSVRERHASQR